MNIQQLFPELKEIQNDELQEKVSKSLAKAIKMGGWTEKDLKMIPFTLLIPEIVNEDLQPDINIIDHIRAVTQMCIATYERYEMLGLGDKLNKDELIAGGLLHDVGKFIEYKRDEKGQIVQKLEGKYIRHPAMGLEIVYEFNLPIIVRQAIVFHSKEGDQIPRFTEVEIIHRCDFLCYAPVKQLYQQK